jgi:hypothetical protein
MRTNTWSVRLGEYFESFATLVEQGHLGAMTHIMHLFKRKANRRC